MITYKYGFRKHCGSLKDSLATSKYVTVTEFNSKIENYEYYGTDTRCNQVLFIAKNIFKRKYTWAFVEIIETTKEEIKE